MCLIRDKDKVLEMITRNRMIEIAMNDNTVIAAYYKLVIALYSCVIQISYSFLMFYGR